MRVKMSQYGVVQTGRNDASIIAGEILKDLDSDESLYLDFTTVRVVTTSFAHELLLTIRGSHRGKVFLGGNITPAVLAALKASVPRRAADSSIQLV